MRVIFIRHRRFVTDQYCIWTTPVWDINGVDLTANVYIEWHMVTVNNGRAAHMCAEERFLGI
jgi:hypothetical protein